MYVLKFITAPSEKILKDVYETYHNMVKENFMIMVPGMELYLVDDETGNCSKVVKFDFKNNLWYN